MSNVIDLIYKTAFRQKRRMLKDGSDEHDGTGVVLSDLKHIPIIYQDIDTVFAMYDLISHSFWRSQEFSLFLQHIKLLTPPIADFGCGDGSFASVLLKNINYGIDIDVDALNIAAKYGIYDKIIKSENNIIPLGDGVVNSVFSNSVLEHTVELETMLSEINRILAKGGNLIFTVPVARFTEDFAKYFGKKASDRANRQAYHRNLFDADWWTNTLHKHGFKIVTIKHYQPDWFTFYYWMSRFIDKVGLISNELKMKIWEKCKDSAIKMIKTSIKDTNEGANIFIIARKND
ncbi:MAG: class I SAM-dependent methyltransferase [Nitrospirae bacterium]|nr:class I SAM-dependent methyltransferase [Nitrospirota bacterium]MBF0540269.1 class I SAM-dependent methyltransferase [Nitrospirota bacterium]